MKQFTHLSRFHSLNSGSSTFRREAEMAHESGFAFNFGVVLAMAVIIVAITTWADHFPNPERNSAAPIAARQAIYPAQIW